MTEPSSTVPATNSPSTQPTANPVAAPVAVPGIQPTQSAPAPGSQPQPVTTPAVEPVAPVPATAYALKIPEGTALDASVVAAFGTQAHGAGVTQEAAQKMLEALAPIVAQSETSKHQGTVQRWQQQAAADPRFGGTAKAAEVAASVDMALERAGTPALRELLTKSGLIEEPDLRYLLAQTGLAFRPDGAPVRGTPTEGKPTRFQGVMTPEAAAKQMPYTSMRK